MRPLRHPQPRRPACSDRFLRCCAIACVLSLACLLAAVAAPGASPAATRKAPVAEHAAPLECSALQLSTAQATLPALDVSATLTLRNPASSPAVVVRPSLGFFTETASGKWRDVSTSIYVEPDAANPWLIAPGQNAQLKFKVQLLHDTPAGRLRAAPRVEYFSQSDNAFPLLTDFGKSAREWQVDNPAQKFNATATLVTNESTPESTSAGAPSAVQLSVADNRLKGRIMLQSPQSTLRPDTDYVAGVFFKSDRSGWDSPINKGAAITEFDAKGAIRAHPMHLFEVPYWSWETTRFKSQAGATHAKMEVWNRGWALGQKSQSWCGAAFLVPEGKDSFVLTGDPKEPPRHRTPFDELTTRGRT